MVCDLDVLDAVLARIDARLRGQNLDVIRPAEAEAVTVEVFARWAHGAISDELAGSGVDHVSVRDLRERRRVRRIRRSPALIAGRGPTVRVACWRARAATASPAGTAITNTCSARPPSSV